ncbi:MAG: hypothetical protein K0S30_2110 [Clostridia bacterium]|nr:hypothetical protein [Clostridia bacterium]
MSNKQAFESMKYEVAKETIVQKVFESYKGSK